MASGLLTAGGGHAWETEVVAALDHPGASLTVVRRCADMADVLATASTGQAVACLLAADLRRLDSESVQQLTAFGVSVVVVYAAADQWASVRLDRIGVTAMVADDAGADEMITAVRDALAAGSAPGRPPRSAADPLWALRSPDAADGQPSHRDPASGGAPGAGAAADRVAPAGLAGPLGGSAPGTPGRPVDLRPDAARPVTGPIPAVPRGGPDGPGAGGGSGVPGEPEPTPGVVIAVWGPGGAPGRSTVAMGIADRAAAAGRSVLLIDADVYGGILASAFGLLDESPGLAGACRLAANGRLDVAELTRLCWSVGERLALLTGIARADRWPEVRPSALPAVLRIARLLADLVVVDCAAVLEADEEISFDTMAPRRNGATLAVLDEADALLAVGSADPPGMERLVRGLTELAVVVDGRSPRVVLNRVRRTAASAGELVTAVRRFSGHDPVALLPEDRAACDRAWQRGVTLSAAAPKSALVAGFDELAAALAPSRAAASTGVRASAAVPR